MPVTKSYTRSKNSVGNFTVHNKKFKLITKKNSNSIYYTFSVVENFLNLYI